MKHNADCSTTLLILIIISSFLYHLYVSIILILPSSIFPHYYRIFLFFSRSSYDQIELETIPVNFDASSRLFINFRKIYPQERPADKDTCPRIFETIPDIDTGNYCPTPATSDSRVTSDQVRPYSTHPRWNIRASSREALINVTDRDLLPNDPVNTTGSIFNESSVFHG